ncbi:hypothetical protein K466DRAFT_492211 [Polyporus arcularius HHB13444]|uniref:DUF1793-domain-containing protein n=1 Tax=Polyporus arcularius HHB13444 TaxID=1314778 RepID=A0A5C3PDS8_9APHY|nr:hypothetical protein K466DRAFT_492211 [Polyporus arcularius HHB13444]
MLCSLLCLTVLVLLADCQRSFFPSSIPLAVRSPYLSVWYNSAAGTQPLSSSWPLFWRGAIIGWTGRIRVDGVTFSWMGSDTIWNNTADVLDIQITPTRTIFFMQAGPLNVTVTYLSPIEPSDWVNQSTPFSYVSVEARSLDGAAHAIQLYSDVSSGQPTDGQDGNPVSWSNTLTAQSLYHETQPEIIQRYTENAQQAQDGRAYSMALRPGLTWEIDTDVNCRQQFMNSGNLTKMQQGTSGPMGQPWYVFAIAVDLGSIQSTSSPVTWAIGYVRDPVVQHKTSSGVTEDRRPYWTIRYPDIGALIDAFVNDYSTAYARAVELDERVMGEAAKVSSQYIDLVSLVARQVMGALDITVLGGSGNGVEATDVKAFMKDVGYTQQINTVQRMFAAFPAYLYFNASLGGALLAPLLESQANLSGQVYAAQNLGITCTIGLLYPNATGPSGDHPQGIEQSGNMLIMMYAHARVSGDGSLLSRHYDTAKRWADYLVKSTLTPVNQESAEGLQNSNMTNLAIKGIIGVKSMAEISRAMQCDADTLQYDSQAKDLAERWLSLAQSSDGERLLGQYGNESSSAMLYNIYADLLLGTQLIDQDVLAKQTEYYNILLETQASPHGLYIDNALGNEASVAWMFFTAASVTDDGVRDQLIHYALDMASSNKTGAASPVWPLANQLPDYYDVVTGDKVNYGGGAGPALGGIFSLLAFTIPNKTIIVVQDTPSRTPGSSGGGSGSSDSNVVGVVGGALGGTVLLLVILTGAGVFFWRRRRQRHSGNYHYKDNALEHPQPYHYRVAYQQEYTSNPYADTDSTAAKAEIGSTRPDVATDSSLVDAPYVGRSKARKLAREMEQQSRPSPASSGSADPVTLPTREVASSETGPSSGTQGANSALLTTDVLGLRAEMENLRRVVQGIREERQEPPPQYGE